MCKVGGPRCEMTHTARARWGAKRKARTAYRRAMAHAIATSTHEPAMEKLVKNMNMADINELATYMGIDTDTVAASCDSQTYTSPDGETVTVDVEAEPCARRTPVTRAGVENKLAVLAEASQSHGMNWKPDTPYWNAVLYGDADAQKDMADQVAKAGKDAEKLLDAAETDTELLHAYAVIDSMAHQAEGQCGNVADERIGEVADECLRALTTRGLTPKQTLYATDSLKDIDPDLYMSLMEKKALGSGDAQTALATKTTKEVEEYAARLKTAMDDREEDSPGMDTLRDLHTAAEKELKRRGGGELSQGDISLANITELSRRGGLGGTNPDVTGACVAGLSHALYASDGEDVSALSQERAERTLRDITHASTNTHADDSDDDIKRDPIAHYGLRKNSFDSEGHAGFTPLGNEMNSYKTFVYTDDATGNIIEVSPQNMKNAPTTDAERQEYAELLASTVPPLVRQSQSVTRVPDTTPRADQFLHNKHALDNLASQPIPDHLTNVYVEAKAIRCAHLLRDETAEGKTGTDKLNVLIDRARASTQLSLEVGSHFSFYDPKNNSPIEAGSCEGMTQVAADIARARMYDSMHECATYADELDKKNGVDNKGMTYARAVDIVASSSGVEGWGFRCGQPEATRNATEESIKRIREGAANGVPLDDLTLATIADGGGVGHDDVVTAREKLATLMDSSPERDDYADDYLAYGDLCVEELSRDHGENYAEYLTEYPGTRDNDARDYAEERSFEGYETHAQARMAAAVKRFYDPDETASRLDANYAPSVADPEYYSVNTDALPAVGRDALGDLISDYHPDIRDMPEEKRDIMLADDAYCCAYDMLKGVTDDMGDDDVEHAKRWRALMQTLNTTYDSYIAGDTTAAHTLVNLYGAIHARAVDDEDVTTLDMHTHQYVDPNQGALF